MKDIFQLLLVCIAYIEHIRYSFL